MNLKFRVEKLECKADSENRISSIFIRFVPGPIDDPDGQIVAAGLQLIEDGRGQIKQRWTRNEDESEDAFMARAKADVAIEPGRVGLFLSSYRQDTLGKPETRPVGPA